MRVKPMYVALLADGTILPGGATADSAIKAMEREGVPLAGTQVDDIGSATTLAHETRRNEGERTAGAAYARNALKNAGLPVRLTRSDVMGGELADAQNAVRRLYPIFQHHRAESTYGTGEVQILTKGKFAGQQREQRRQEIIAEIIDPITGKKTKKVAWGPVAFVKDVAHVMEPGGRLTDKQVISFATELMGDNSKLVKGTTTRTSPYSMTTEKDGRLIGLNLYPAGKLAHEFVAAYPYHPISQIITSIQQGRGVPRYVTSIPTGRDERVERVATDFTPEQEANLISAFGKTTFTLCSGASKACMRSCLVYTGQNTASIKNDWKKAACAFALIADPAAYLRLVHMEVERNARLAARKREMFFVRMNLLSDIPWEEMVPWFFRDFDGEAGRPFVQFYDYTKIKGRDSERNGVSNYDLTFSFSGTNAGTITEALYERNRRVAVVFVGFQLENGELVRVSKPKGEAGYGYGLPVETDIFAPSHLVGTQAGMRTVVNADKHDARPLDPPNRLHPDMACIAGLVWKDAGGGATMTPAQKAAAATALQDAGKFVTYTELVEGTGKFKVADRSGREFRYNGQRVTGFLIAPETPRQTRVGLEGASLLPGM